MQLIFLKNLEHSEVARLAVDWLFNTYTEKVTFDRFPKLPNSSLSETNQSLSEFETEGQDLVETDLL